MRTNIAAVALALGVAAGTAASAAEPLNIPVIVPLTGGGAFLGQGHKASLDILAETVNATGGIKGRPLHFVFHDDQSSPQVAVQLANEVLADKPSVIIGSSLVAMCRAMAPLVQNGPVEYCLSPAVHPKPGGFVFSSGASGVDQETTDVRYFRMMGWPKIALLSNTDATGQDIDKTMDEILALPENKDVKLVAREHFNPTDVSVAAQIERIKASGAQAMVAGVTGSPAATVFKAMVQAGLTIDVAPTSGNEVFAQMEQWESFLPKGLVMASDVFPPHQGLWKLDPRVEAAQKTMNEALAKHGLKADNIVATCWDAGLIVIDALKTLGPDATAEQIRQYIANLTDFAGINGLYDFKKNPERGLGADSAIMVRYDAPTKEFVWLSQPGGAPLKK